MVACCEDLAEAMDRAAEETTKAAPTPPPQPVPFDGRASTLRAMLSIGNADKERFGAITPAQIASMKDEEQAQLPNIVFWCFSPEQTQAVKGKNLKAAVINQLANDRLDPSHVDKFSAKQIAKMSDEEQRLLQAEVYRNFPPALIQAVNGQNLTASLLNDLARPRNGEEILRNFTPKQFAALPPAEKLRLGSTVLAFLESLPKRTPTTGSKKKKNQNAPRPR